MPCGYRGHRQEWCYQQKRFQNRRIMGHRACWELWIPKCHDPNLFLNQRMSEHRDWAAFYPWSIGIKPCHSFCSLADDIMQCWPKLKGRQPDLMGGLLRFWSHVLMFAHIKNFEVGLLRELIHYKSLKIVRIYMLNLLKLILYSNKFINILKNKLKMNK